MSSSRAAAHTSEASVSVTTTPPARLCVFSISTSVVAGNSMCPRGLRAARNSSAVNEPLLTNFGHLDAGVGRGRARLVPHGVALAADDDVVTRTRQHLERHLVRHRPARQPEP